MSQENITRNSLRQTSIMKSKATLKLNKPTTEHNIKSYRKLPLIKEKKYSSSKNLAVSSTCDIITSFPEEFKNSCMDKLKKRSIIKYDEKKLEADIEPLDIKHFFQKRKHAMQSIDLAQLKKYSSCNKLASFPSIPQIQIPNDQSYVHNEYLEPQCEIKSTNSIKLETIQYLKRPKLGRIPLNKMLKTHMSKTINPRKLQSQNSIEIQNEEKNVMAKKKSKLSKDVFDRVDSKTKILVKNPFNRLPKKHSQIGEKFSQLQHLQTLQEEFRLSKIWEDGNDESQISMSGKFDIENLIGQMNR